MTAALPTQDRKKGTVHQGEHVWMRNAQGRRTRDVRKLFVKSETKTKGKQYFFKAASVIKKNVNKRKRCGKNPSAEHCWEQASE